MYRKLISTLLFTGLIGSTAFADDDAEYMEVTGVSECCQSSLPGGLGLLVGWVGASGASSGSATLKDTALKNAMQKAAKQKTKAKEKKEEQKAHFDEVTKAEGGALEALINQLGALLLQATDNGGVQTMKYKGPNGEELEFKDCVPSGPLNPNKLTCTEEKYEIFTDPTDGVEKWAFSMSVIEPKYNPKHYDADSSGYYPAVVDGQTFTIVFENRSEFEWQFRQVVAAK